MKELAIIIPVFNEANVIQSVITKWLNHIESFGIDYEMHVYNDGSTDSTSVQLGKIMHPRLFVHESENCGHGPTILKGYKSNLDKQWLFQVDSDDELDIDEFGQFWSARDSFDFMLPTRSNRKINFFRSFITSFSYYTVIALFGRGIHEVNSPYRFMRVTEDFAGFIRKLPDDMKTPNIIISGYFALKKRAVLQLPVRFRARNTGKPSLVNFKLLHFAVSSFLQVLKFRFINMKK